MRRVRTVLIHGFGCSREDWSAQMECLARVADVVALDLPGHGNAGLFGESSIGAMADAVNRVRQDAPSACTVLVGHSMGCRVALESARRAPENLVGLVLIEGSQRAIGDADEAVRRYRSHSAEENRALLMRDFGGMFSNATPGSFQMLALRRIENMDRDFIVRLMEDMTRWDAADAAEALRAIRVPVLAMQSTYKEPGQERRPIEVGEVSSWLRLVSEQIPGGAEIVWLTELGHFPQVEAPEMVNIALATFIERLVPSGREAGRAAGLSRVEECTSRVANNAYCV